MSETITPDTPPEETAAAQEALESAKTGGSRSTIAKLEEAIKGTGDEELTWTLVGGEYHIARQNENGHTYVSPALSLREAIIWIDGYAQCAADLSPEEDEAPE